MISLKPIFNFAQSGAKKSIKLLGSYYGRRAAACTSLLAIGTGITFAAHKLTAHTTNPATSSRDQYQCREITAEEYIETLAPHISNNFVLDKSAPQEEQKQQIAQNLSLAYENLSSNAANAEGETKKAAMQDLTALVEYTSGSCFKVGEELETKAKP